MSRGNRAVVPDLPASARAGACQIDGHGRTPSAVATQAERELAILRVVLYCDQMCHTPGRQPTVAQVKSAIHAEYQRRTGIRLSPRPK